MAKVLYVDADEIRTAAAVVTFRDRGHAVTSADSAERAMLHVEQRGDYDAVVVHLILPSIDGAEFCRWLSRRRPMAGTPRVVFSGHGVRMRLDLKDGLPRWLPADVYLHELEDVTRLVDAVERTLADA